MITLVSLRISFTHILIIIAIIIISQHLSSKSNSSSNRTAILAPQPSDNMVLLNPSNIACCIYFYHALLEYSTPQSCKDDGYQKSRVVARPITYISPQMESDWNYHSLNEISVLRLSTKSVEGGCRFPRQPEKRSLQMGRCALEMGGGRKG